MLNRGFWVEEPRYISHPYYAEWKFDFLEVNNSAGGVVTPSARERVREWILGNCIEPAYIVGNRVSFKSEIDAMAFQMTWG